MEDLSTAVENTPDVVEVVVDPTPEAPVSEVVAPEVPSSPFETLMAGLDEAEKEDTTETATEEAVEEAPEAEVAEEEPATEETETAEEPAPPAEPISYTDKPLDEVIEAVSSVKDAYELPADVEALISELTIRAQAPATDFAEYAEYGDADQIRTLLDREALLTGLTRTETGQFRPTTDKFIETLPDTTKDYLYQDLGSAPSKQYQGLSQFEETLVNAFGKDGEPISDVMSKYRQFVDLMQTGTLETDMPSFVPTNLKEAYGQLARDTKDSLTLLDPTDESDKPLIDAKIKELSLIQRGLDFEKQEKQTKVVQAQQAQQDFQDQVINRQVKFYDNVRNSFAEDMLKSVKFSDDANIQTLLAHQQVTLFTEATEDSPSGEFARNALAKAGVQFDYPKVQTMMNNINQAAIALQMAESMVDANNKPLDEIALNKARATWTKASSNLLQYGKEIITQTANLASTGKAKDVETAVAKKKVAIKARPGVSDAGAERNKAKAKSAELPPMGDPARYERLAELYGRTIVN